jgi:catechol 2,3-dioxygenase-like lactoylglutathione lyase family enzyme
MRNFRVTDFLHVNVEVTDLERALRFYRLFGLVEIERAGAPMRRGAWLRFPGGQQLHLSVGTPRPGARAHFAILVEDLAAARALLEDAGAPIETERDIPGVVRFFSRDPDGNRIEFQQRTSG